MEILRPKTYSFYFFDLVTINILTFSKEPNLYKYKTKHIKFGDVYRITTIVTPILRTTDVQSDRRTDN